MWPAAWLAVCGDPDRDQGQRLDVILVTPVSTSVQVGETVQLLAGLPGRRFEYYLTGDISWTSSDSAVATVTASGVVTGAGEGTATVTAVHQNWQGRADITVTSTLPGAQVLVGAGDIARCGHDGDEATASLLDSIPGTVFTAGDNAYNRGSPRDFAECYDPSWGRHKLRTYPTPGNHDYATRGAAGYYAYFGSRAPGPYYSYDLGDWHIVSLNTEVGMGQGSAQERWLRADLGASRRRCTLAVWHRPRFSSASSHGSARRVAPLWQALYDYHGEVVISGHDHVYERFAPQAADGALDTLHGLRQFVVGTGGADRYEFGQPAANSEVRANAAWGVLKLVLSRDRYTWQFIPVAGDDFTDSGSGSCH